MGSYCHSGGSYFTCCAEMDFTVNNSHFFLSSTWHTARDALHLSCRAGLPRTAVTVFRLPRGTLRVMRMTTMVQLTLALLVCVQARTVHDREDSGAVLQQVVVAPVVAQRQVPVVACPFIPSSWPMRMWPRSSSTSVAYAAGWFCWFRCVSRCVLFDWRQARVFRYHGRC